MTTRDRMRFAAEHASPYPSGDGPAWIECEGCGDYLCTEHSTAEEPVHAVDCRCPAVEEWHALGISPYRDPYPGDEAF